MRTTRRTTSPTASARRCSSPTATATTGCRSARRLRLWWDLVSRWGGDPVELPHRFLNFTGENHWILSPANYQIWYETVLGFCGEHVLGRPWTRPDLL